MSCLKKAANAFFKYHKSLRFETCEPSANLNDLLYEYFAKICAGEECECQDPSEETGTLQDCSITVSDVEVNRCDIVIYDPGLYINVSMSTIEQISYLLSTVNINDESLVIQISEFNIDGNNVLPATIDYLLTPDNISTITYKDLEHVTNIIDFLNSLNIPNFYFSIDVGWYNNQYFQIMRVQYPKDLSWSIRTLANDLGDNHIDGLLIDNNGLNEVQITTGGAWVSPTPVYAWYIGTERPEEFYL